LSSDGNDSGHHAALEPATKTGANLRGHSWKKHATRRPTLKVTIDTIIHRAIGLLQVGKTG
jgi:hypothetical protein